MTILFFSRLFLPHIGGVEKHVFELSKELIKKNYKIIVVTEKNQLNNSSAKITGEIDGIKIYRIDAGGENVFKKFRVWWWLWQNRHLIENADIVHCHDVFFWYIPFRFLYPNKPIYTTFHGYETKFPPSKKAIFIRKVSERLSWGNICVGDYIKKWYGTRPNLVTYGGVDIGKIRNLNIEIRNKIKILFIGRLEKDTGVLNYLKVLELMRKRKIKFDLEACGDGSLKKMVEDYGKVNGFVDDLNTYIEKADIVFASSYLSILEAMAAKKLVFCAYDNKLKEDYLKMSPFAKWIVIEDSSTKLSDKVWYFIQHKKEKDKVVHDAYEWVKKQTWKKVADGYINLWGLQIL